MKKILVTGSDGRFGKVLKRIKTKKKLIFKNKKELNIMSTTSIKNCLKKNKPKYILHLAGLSLPMNVHDKNIAKSIDLNIIGTCNVVKEASKLNIKVIYLLGQKNEILFDNVKNYFTDVCFESNIIVLNKFSSHKIINCK